MMTMTKETGHLRYFKKNATTASASVHSTLHESQGTFSLYTDGASRGNPGKSGAGIVLKDSSGKTVKKIRKYLGIGTNNQAEYNALLIGLNLAKVEGAKKLNVYLDSELVVKQINGEYRVKNPEIKLLYQKVLKITREFDKINILHIPRELNGVADSLANKAIDLGGE